MREKKSFDGRNAVRCLRCGDILFKGKEAKEAELVCRKCDTVFYMAGGYFRRLRLKPAACR